jgi:hypothetical protein
MNNYDEEQWHNYLYTQYERRQCEPEEELPPSTENMSVYDLMGDDYYPYITKNSNGDYTISIEDYHNNVIAENNEANTCVLDGFAEFCRRYLASYERLQEKK